MSNHRTQREIADNRANVISCKTEVVRRYIEDGASLASLCRDYEVGSAWMHQQLEAWQVPRRARKPAVGRQAGKTLDSSGPAFRAQAGSPWSPPSTMQALPGVPAKLRQGQARDSASLLEDVKASLDNLTPAEVTLSDLAFRLHAHLKRLTAIATAAEADRSVAHANHLLTPAAQVQVGVMLVSHLQGVEYLRRIAWTVNQLLEHQCAINCINKGS
ncbi:DUF6415 family natural product biosynthesis protein [Streptomyces sp. NPDC006173]|uniref:DUF6415 family natural product biosynthesis protein n=1 Tax=Streptomyces sp. NPDC006173 TaxID=3155349 RepID=UPI0033CF1B6E